MTDVWLAYYAKWAADAVIGAFATLAQARAAADRWYGDLDDWHKSANDRWIDLRDGMYERDGMMICRVTLGETQPVPRRLRNSEGEEGHHE